MRRTIAESGVADQKNLDRTNQRWMPQEVWCDGLLDHLPNRAFNERTVPVLIEHEARNIGILAVCQGFDTSTSMGKIMLQLVRTLPSYSMVISEF